MGAEPFVLHGLTCGGAVASACGSPPSALPVTCGEGGIIVGCRPGDLHPDGLGDGVVGLEDWVLAGRKLRDDVAILARDLACSDLGASGSCLDENGVRAACPEADADWGQDDVDTVRALAAGTARPSCPTCLSASTPAAARLPGDVAPRGETDDRVDVGDVLLILRWAVGLSLDPPLSAEELLRADLAPGAPEGELLVVGGDGSVDVGDVLLTLRAAVGLERLAWPSRRLTIETNQELAAVAFAAETSGWPAWAC